ncbi:hypothetical protein FHT67_001381 [Paenibacillus sp. BK720]|nr:hypothetical protein [Paenibacillus sp. BK720]
MGSLSQLGRLKVEINESLKQLLNYRNVQEEEIKKLIIDSRYVFEHEGEEYDDYSMSTEMSWFPVTFRNSLFLSTFAFFEHTLTKLCKLLKERDNLTLNLRDIQGGSTMERMQKYLKYVAKLNFPDNSTNWSFLKSCNTLRNSLIHSYGEIDEKVSKLLPTLNITNDITKLTNELLGYTRTLSRSDIIFTEERFYLLFDFCKETIYAIGYFFKEIFDCNPNLLDDKWDTVFVPGDIGLP